jgi:putative ABC transport system permease protein
MKYFSKYFCKSLLSMKPNIIILFALSMLSSFMYFFVQISIDGNIKLLESKTTLNNTEKELLISLQSNQTLALSFLLILSLITGLIYFMFYKKHSALHQKEYGCFIAHGYSADKMAGIVFLISIAFIAAAYICGLFLGWISSDVMLNLYKEIYSLEYLRKGLAMQNGFIALVGTLLPALSSIPIIIRTVAKDTINLLNENNNKVNLRIGRFTRTVTKKLGYSFRLALRKPFQLLMSAIAVVLFTMLFIISFSLNLSSQYLFHIMSEGRNYTYDITFPTLQNGQNDNLDHVYYISEPININLDKKRIDGSILGIEPDNRFLSLKNMKAEEIKDIPENNVVISQALSSLYRIQQGTDISIVLNHKTISMSVFAIAENADNFTIYTSKNTLEALLNIHAGSFNGLYTNVLSDIPDTGHVQSINEREKQLEENNVSNRISAVICQMLACIIGCLLLYLTILLKFQEDTKSIFILDMMGYTSKQINQMFISVYRPVLNIAFILLLIPSIEICKTIHKTLSLATNDFIPFQSNVFIFLVILLLLNLLYSIIKYLFNFRISRIQKSGASVRYLN